MDAKYSILRRMKSIYSQGCRRRYVTILQAMREHEEVGERGGCVRVWGGGGIGRMHVKNREKRSEAVNRDPV